MRIITDHILIVVNNLEESINFYELLGFRHLETVQRPTDIVGVLQKDELKLELMKLPEGEETYRTPRKDSDIGFRHIGFKVDNLRAVYEHYKDKITFQGPPVESAGRGTRKLLFFHDPNGVELHFIQEE
jgi:catechol 2,3-dioxygenase-like lactoylglutathione lyase family enzyme